MSSAREDGVHCAALFRDEVEELRHAGLMACIGVNQEPPRAGEFGNRKDTLEVRLGIAQGRGQRGDANPCLGGCDQAQDAVGARRQLHAFEGRAGGTIRITLASADAGLLRLTVEDDGVGLPPSETRATSTGMGMRLLDGFLRQLEATLTVEGPPGTRFIVLFPSRS